MENPVVYFKPEGRVPTHAPERATDFACGYDIFAAIAVPLDINPGTTVRIATGFSVATPPNIAMLLLPRSGLATKYGIVLANEVGLIDPDYRGEVLVALRNMSRNQYTLSPGERIAQALFVPIIHPEFKVTDHLPPSGRGRGGFGSTGSF